MDYERITKMLDITYAWSITLTFSREEAVMLHRVYKPPVVHLNALFVVGDDAR